MKEREERKMMTKKRIEHWKAKKRARQREADDTKEDETKTTTLPNIGNDLTENDRYVREERKKLASAPPCHSEEEDGKERRQRQQQEKQKQNDCLLSIAPANHEIIETTMEEDDDDNYDEEVGESYQSDLEARGSSRFFTLIDNAYRVSFIVIDQRHRGLEEEHRNAPLVEGQPAPHKQEDNQEEYWFDNETIRFIAMILLFVLMVIIVAIVVPIAAIATRPSSSHQSNNNNQTSLPVDNNTLTTTITFDNVVSLLGLDKENTLLLDPNHYISSSIQWMAHVDQVTPILIQQQLIKNNGQESTIQQREARQRFALVCLYFATKGESWTEPLGFLDPTTHECEWQVFGREQFLLGGTTIYCVNRIITGIALNDNNLGGQIPDEIGLLTQLTELELRNNEIGGTLPSSLSQLSRLVGLDLDRNRLSGSIPSELTALENLGLLFLRLNFLTGSIPESIGNLTNLVWLNLLSNILTGSIPPSIQNITMLQWMDVRFNLLTSTLPTQINTLKPLEILDVSGNFLTGTLPFEANSNPSLELFRCDLNSLTGDISGLAHLSRLTSLSFSNNKFTGTIPTGVCNLALGSINGNSNMLSGSLPNCLSDLTSLKHLALNNNNLAGSIPTLPTLLKELALQRNHLTGKIPSGPFPKMTLLNLFSNNFTIGTIPTELAAMSFLQILNLEDCQLSGTIHTELGRLTKLSQLFLGNNALSGTIPTEVGLLEDLEHLGLESNSLTGTIPWELGNLSFLDVLDMNSNQLTGSIPNTLLFVEQMALHSNNLTGNVGSFCQQIYRSLASFLADCHSKLTNCTCCTACCDVPPSQTDNDKNYPSGCHRH